MSHKTLTARTPHLISSGVLPVVHIIVRPLGATHANSGGGGGGYTKCGRFDNISIVLLTLKLDHGCQKKWDEESGCLHSPAFCNLHCL